jgi:hypothetical protein
MVRGSPQFTPRQLLDAGHRAEAEGKLDLAQQFYGHLRDHYGHTSEAAEGLRGLVRIGAPGHQPGIHQQVWQVNGTASAGPALNGRASIGREREKRVRHAAQGPDYRVGRALAALLSGAGWLSVAAALLVLAGALATELTQAPALQGLKLGFAVLPQAAGALAAGAAALLVGQAARALFDQASAARELAAIERARSGSDHA